MSSIYDALQRIQGEKGSWAGNSAKAVAPPARKKMIMLVLASVLAGSLCTGGVFYAVRIMGEDSHRERSATVAQGVQAEKAAAPVQAAPVAAPEMKPDPQAVPQQPASAHPDTVDGYLALGEKLYLAKDYDKALQIYTEAVHYYHSDARILNNLGSVYLAKGQVGKAIHYYQESRSTSKDFVEPVYNLACAYAVLGDKTRSIENLKLACTMNPEVKKWAVQDPDLKGLNGNAEFKRIISVR